MGHDRTKKRADLRHCRLLVERSKPAMCLEHLVGVVQITQTTVYTSMLVFAKAVAQTYFAITRMIH